MREPFAAEMLSLAASVTDDMRWRVALQRLAGWLGASGLAVISRHRGDVAWVGHAVPDADVRATRQRLTAGNAPLPVPARGPRPDAGPASGAACLHEPAASGGTSHVVLMQDDGQVQAAVHLHVVPGAPALGEAAQHEFVGLAPHLTALHALALRIATMEAGERRAAHLGLADGHAWVLLDAGAAIVDLNDGARDILAARDGLREDASRIHVMSARDAGRWSRALKQQLEGDLPKASTLVRVGRPTGRKPYALFIDRVPGGPGGLLPAAPLVHVRIVDLEAEPLVPHALLRQLHGLTAAEAQVVARLAGGDTSESAAQRLGISPHTVRHHLERIFAKTGVHRQSDLVRLVYAPFVAADFRAPPA
ncbi:MAG: hypothetical protein C0505_03805 [Leptothrix sp. (in: Bacteria)]|nr:hypothetical protein [Leptothrix sp. (in: b-proteobacteria)]